MTEIAASDGTKLAVHSMGSGPPVLLVHGITESSQTWDPVAGRLSTTNEVIRVDLRGHGNSQHNAPYDLATMAGDLAAVVDQTCDVAPRLIGHSLGGVVVSALAGVVSVHSVVNVDQSLRLDQFQAQLQAAAPMLRDPDSFPLVLSALFDDLAGSALSEAERARIEAARGADQEVVLGIWHDVIESDPADLRALVDATASSVTAPYLSLFGIDPGDDYADWMSNLVPTATVELWPDLGHYPHLVEPDRFVARVHEFWNSI